MEENEKSRADLIREVEELRCQVAELEALEDRRLRAESALREAEEKSREALIAEADKRMYEEKNLKRHLKLDHYENKKETS